MTCSRRILAFLAMVLSVLPASAQHVERIDAYAGWPVGDLVRHGDSLRLAAFNPSGTQLSILDPVARDTVHAEAVMPSRLARVYALAPDGSWWVEGRTTNTDPFARIRGAIIRHGVKMAAMTDTVGVLETPPVALALHPDGRIVSAEANGSLILWKEDASGSVHDTLTVIARRVDALRVSPDGRWLGVGVPANEEGASRVQMWNLDAGVPHDTLAVYDRIGDAADLAFSPSGAHLAVPQPCAGDSVCVAVHDLDAGRMVHTLPFHDNPFSTVSLAWGPDGRWLVASAGNRLVVWEASTGAVAMTRAGEMFDDAVALAFSADARRLVEVVADDAETFRVRRWNVGAVTHPPGPDALEVVLQDGHAASIQDLVFAPDNRLLATGDNAGVVKLWDAAQGRLIRTWRDVPSTALAFNPDGQRLVGATTQGDAGFSVWDVTAGHEQFSVTVSAFAYESPARDALGYGVEEVCWSPDGTTLATAGGQVALWDAATGALVRVFPEAVDAQAVAFSPDGRWLAASAGAGGNADTVHVWNARTGAHHATLTGHEDGVHALAFAPDGHLISGSRYEEATLRIWDVEAARLIDAFDGDVITSLAVDTVGRALVTNTHVWELDRWSRLRTLDDNMVSERRTALRPDGTMLAVADGADLRLEAFDTAPDRRVLPAPGMSDAVLAFHPAGAQLAMLQWKANNEGAVVLWSVASATVIARQPIGLLGSTFASPDQRLLYTPSGDTLAVRTKREILLLDATTLDRLGTLPVAPPEVPFAEASIMAMAPDGRSMITGSPAGADSLLRRWDLASGRVDAALPTPHDHVWGAAYSPDGRYLLATSEDAAALLHTSDAAWATLEPAVSQMASSYRFSPDSRWIAASADSVVYVWESRTGRLRHTLRSPAGSLGGVTFSHAGDLLYGKTSYRIERWRLDTGRRLRPLQADAGNTLAALPDGRHLAALGSLRSAVYDVTTGERKQGLTTLRYADAHVVSPSGPWAAATDSASVVVWRLRPNRTVFTLRARTAPVEAIAHPSGTDLVAGAGPGGVRLWNRRSGTLDRVLPHDSERTGALALTADGAVVATSSGYAEAGATLVWDVASGDTLAALPDHTDLFAFLPGPTLQWVVASADSVWVGDLRNPLRRALPASHFNGALAALSVSSAEAVVAAASARGAITLWDADAGTLRDSLRHEPYTGKLTALAFSPDGAVLATATSVDVQSLMLWEVARGDTLRFLETALPSGDVSDIRALAFSPDGTRVAAAHGTQISLWNTADGRFLGTLGSHAQAVTGVAFTDDGRLLSSGRDGQIKVWDVAARDEQVALIAVDDDDFVAVTPGLTYRSTKGALRGIAFRQGADVYDFDAFDLRLNRPDDVIERLGGDADRVRLFREARDRRLQRLGVTGDALQAADRLPRLQVTSDVPTFTARRTISIAVAATASTAPLAQLDVLVNDVPLFGRRGLELHGRRAVDTTFTVPLGQGENELDVRVRDASGTASLAETHTVVYTGSLRRPDLHLVAIGVSDYADDAYDLTYAASDADSVVAFWRARASQYAAVHVHRLTDADVTRERVLVLRDSLMQTHVDDHVVLFLAGHGLLSDDATYYFAPYDIDFAEPASRGLSYADIEGLLDGIPARQKLLLMDTCHSGEADGTLAAGAVDTTRAARGTIVQRGLPMARGTRRAETGEGDSFALLKELFADLRASAGAITIAAAAGAEFAFESDDWGGGVFTYALLQGLRGGRADANADGRMQVSELQDFVRDRVQDLTFGRQTPTVRQENLANNFSLY